MIKIENNDASFTGSGGEILADYGVISCEIIKLMISKGITKDAAIHILYETIELSIKTYERDGEL